MTASYMPMRWPAVWRSPALMELLKGSGIDCLIANRPEIVEAAAEIGIKTIAQGQLPDGVVGIEGLWPGVRSKGFGAAPTTEIWFYSNVAALRLTAARNPGKQVWVRTLPGADTYILAIADAALGGGRWVISLRDELAAEISRGLPEALAVWRGIATTTAFFARHREWTGETPRAVLGVFSDFSTSAEEDVLNRIGRAGQQYRVMVKGALELDGLKALLYVSKVPPGESDRAEALRFAREGGLLIAGPEWGKIDGAVAKAQEHPRFVLYEWGAGTIALAKMPVAESPELANDCAVLVSHRNDLLRFFNAGAVQGCWSGNVLQMLSYEPSPAGDVTVWVAGNSRSARLWMPGTEGPRPVDTTVVRDGIEVHLPGVPRYAAIELT